MIYSAIVEALSSDVEEEVSIVVCGQQLTCFACHLPYRIEVGEIHQVELSPVIFSDYVIDELPGAGCSIASRGFGYSYEVVGWLENGCISCNGLVFSDEAFIEDFAFLDGKRVSWQVDRLDVLFV